MRWIAIFFLSTLSASLVAQVTYHGQIAPILERHCKSCHQDGDIGPMPLTTYEEVASYASMIKFVADTKLMPPFKAAHSKITYANERSISDDERELIAQWIADGTPVGESGTTFTNKKYDANAAYDYTVCMSEPFEHYGIYYDQYQVFPLALDIPEGKYVKDVVFVPGNRKIVRSANISIAPTGTSHIKDQWDPRYGFFAYGSLGFICSFPNWFSWMPHTKGAQLKENELLYLAADSELLLHIHYGPYGEIETDSSCIHFIFAGTPGPILQNVPLVHETLLSDSFLIERGLMKRVSTSFELPINVSLRSVTPLAHLLCRSWEVFAILPDKTSTPILSIEDWDFHWREKYIFQELLDLPKGTKIYTTATYDNSAMNPYNPSDPPHTMKAGPHMYDENFKCYFEFANTESNAGYIVKPFVSAKDFTSEISFHINAPDSTTVILYDVDLQEEKILLRKFYQEGTHTIRKAHFPYKKGRYCISLETSAGMIDSWWFVIL